MGKEENTLVGCGRWSFWLERLQNRRSEAGGSCTMQRELTLGFPLFFAVSLFLLQPHFAAMIPNALAISASNKKPFLNEPTISPATRQAVKITSAFLSVLCFPPLEKCPAFYLSPLLKNMNDGN